AGGSRAAARPARCSASWPGSSPLARWSRCSCTCCRCCRSATRTGSRCCCRCTWRWPGRWARAGATEHARPQGPALTRSARARTIGRPGTESSSQPAATRSLRPAVANLIAAIALHTYARIGSATLWHHRTKPQQRGRTMPIRSLPAALLLCATAATASAAAPPPTAQACSPGNVLCVELGTDNDGRPSYAVLREGRAVIAPSRLGMLFTDVPKFERNLEIAAQRQRRFDETWEQPWGE